MRGSAPIDERQARLVAREAAMRDMRDGTLEVLIGFGLITAGFLSGHPLSMGLIGAVASIAGALQLHRGYSVWRDLASEPLEPMLDLREHPVTLAPETPTAIEDSAYDPAIGAWRPWVLAGAVVVIVVVWWWMIALDGAAK